MSIFKKEVVPPTKEISITDYYGNINIDLLDADDKIIEFDDVSASDFSLLLTNHIAGILTKTQYYGDTVGIIGNQFNKEKGKFTTSLSYHCLLAPILNFEKPLKEIFKNIQKDEKGRDIIYFSKYPIEAVGAEEKENVSFDGKATNQKIHYTDGVGLEDIIDYYPIVSYNDEEYIKATSLVVSNKILRNHESIYYNKTYFIKLKPIKWLCDYENNRLVCLEGLISGIPYNEINEKVDFEESTVYKFLKNCLLPDLMQFVEVPKLEEDKKVDAKDNDIEIKDNILNMLRELLKQIETIKDENDKILIVEDIRVLASIYGKELIKIKNNEKSIYGSSERELIRNGILPYCDYIEKEIKREEREDNKEKENKEIEMVINKLIERASLINDDEVKNDILLQIEELKQDYLSELFKSKRSYQRIDFNKPLEKRKYSNGYETMEYTVTLTLKPTRPVLIKELIEKELVISKRIDMEINNNELRSDLDRFDDYVTNTIKR